MLSEVLGGYGEKLCVWFPAESMVCPSMCVDSGCEEGDKGRRVLFVIDVVRPKIWSARSCSGSSLYTFEG